MWTARGGASHHDAPRQQKQRQGASLTRHEVRDWTTGMLERRSTAVHRRGGPRTCKAGGRVFRSPSALPCVVTFLRASSSLPRARVSTTSVSNLCVKVALLSSRSIRQKRVGCKTTEQESVEWQRQRTKELASPTSPKTCNKFTSTERRLQPPWVWLSAPIRRRRRRGGQGESACTALRNSQPWQCTSA